MVSARDVDRVFLQAVISRGLMSADLAKVLWEQSISIVNECDESLNIPFVNTLNTWNEFVARINRTLDKLDLEFRHLNDELTGREMYALVNRKGDEIAQMATDYNAAEIALFKAIVDQIMLAPREAFSVSSLAALRELSNGKINMSKYQAETVLSSFVATGWLLKSARGRYSLSTRSLLELLPYLKSTYSDEVIECTICMEIVTRGVACVISNCKVRLHYHCFKNYRQRQGQRGCPTCKKEWPRDINDLIPVGEDAANGGDFLIDEADETKACSQWPSQRTGRHNTRRVNIIDEEEEIVEPPQTQSTPRLRRGARR